MRTKPWPILILALAHFLSPFWTLWISARILGFSYLGFVHALAASTAWHEWATLLVFPILGYALWCVESWSYPVYMGLMSVVSINNIYLWWTFPKSLNLAFVVLLNLANIAVVSYFLHPRLRAVFYSTRLKWWKSPPRYGLITTCTVTRENGERIDGRIANLSEGGLFFSCDCAFEIGEKVEFLMETLGIRFAAQAIAVHYLSVKRGYGFQFQHNKESRQQARRVVRALRTLGQRPLGWVSPMTDFKTWSVALLRTGKGLIPELPQQKPSIVVLREKAAEESGNHKNAA